MKKLALHWQILLGMALGVVFALLLTNFGWGPGFIEDWIKPFGTIFINALKLIVKWSTDVVYNMEHTAPLEPEELTAVAPNIVSSSK